MNRMLTCLLALLLLCPVALGEVYAVDYAGSDDAAGFGLLIRDDGTLLTPEGAYRYLGELTPDGTSEGERLYLATPSALPQEGVVIDDYDERSCSRVALVGADGEALTGFDYFDLTLDPTGVVIGRRWPLGADALDRSGNVQFSGDYAALRPTGDGGWLALKPDGKAKDTYGNEVQRFAVLALDSDGAEHDTGFHVTDDNLSPFADGLCPVNGIQELQGRAAFLNPSGERALKRTFDYIGDVSGRLSVVWDGEYCGLADITKGYILKPVYDGISLEKGVFIARRGNRLEVLDAATGEKRFSRRYEDTDYCYGWMFTKDILCVGSEFVRELCDMEGHVLVSYDQVLNINESYSICDGLPQRLVASVGEWPDGKDHLIDLDGAVMSRDWQMLSPAVWQDGHGRYVFTTYRVAKDDDGDAYPLWYTYRYGVCDENGAVILDGTYLSVTVLGLDRYWVQAPDRTGMIDGAGHWYYTVNEYGMLMD